MMLAYSPLSWLFEAMANNADSTALVWHDQYTSYRELLDLVAAWRKRLLDASVRPGQVVAVEGDYSPNSCAVLLALVESGAIVVPLTSAMEAHRAEFLEIAAAEWLIRLDSRDGATVEMCGHDVNIHPLMRQLIDDGEPGLIVFSSGSTGKNKASLHSWMRLLEKFKVPRARLTTLNFLLFDHLGGINTLLHTLSNGGTVVFAQDRDPETVARLIERHSIELLPASPTFLNLLLLSEVQTRYDLSSLKLITYGTEVMPESTLRRLRSAFPDVKLQQTYGLSELGVLRSRSREDGSLWVKVGGEGVETKIVDGTLWIRTRSAMLGYLNAPCPFDAQGWMNTQDCVESDGEYLRILGRQSDIINVGGAKVYPAEVESVLMQMDNVRDVAVSGEPNPITGHIVIASVSLHEPEDPTSLSRRVRQFCRTRLARYKVPSRVSVVEDRAALMNGRYKKQRPSTRSSYHDGISGLTATQS